MADVILDAATQLVGVETKRVKQAARAAIEAGLDVIVQAKRDALEVATGLQAQAAPQLAIISGINAEISGLNAKVQGAQDAIAVLQPYRSIPEVAVFIGVIEASIPLNAALVAAATARAALAALVIPDPITVALAVASAGATGVTNALETAFNDLLELGEDVIDEQIR